MPKLKLFTKISYGIGQLGEGIKNSSFELFLFFYYNQVLGLEGKWAGAATFIALAFDAVFDPFVGSLSDSSRSRFGRRHPFMYAGAVPFGLMFYFLFAPPAGLGKTALFLWLTTFAIAVRAAMAIYLIPHNAMGAELSPDYHERTSIGGWRILFGFVGGFLASGIGLGVFFRDTPEHPFGQQNLEAYPHFAAFFALVATSAVFWSAFGTRSRIPYLPKPARAPEPLSFGRFAGELRDSLKNESFRALFVGTLVFFVTRGVQTTLGLHLSVHFWELGSREILQVNLMGLAGIVVGVPFWSILSRRLDKKPSFLIGVGIFSVAVVAGPVAKLAGLWPERESEKLYLGLLDALSFFAAFGAGAALIAATSMMADLTDEHEFETGMRQEGIFFGAVAFSAKASTGLGHEISGVALDLIGFPVNAERGSVAPEVIRHLGMIYGPATILVLLLGAFYFTRYRLSAARLSDIQKVLEQRRTAIQ